MNFQFYAEKLLNSKEFKEFKKENPDAYFCSGFFVIDKEGKDNKNHFDYFLPKENKIISFQLEDGLGQVPVESIDKRIPNKVLMDYDFSFEEIENLIEKEMEKQKIKSKIQKIIVSLQNIKQKDFLICTVFISMLGLLKVKVSLPAKKIELFEKKSFFDIMKVKKSDNSANKKGLLK
jgi:hypothetical protein